MQTLDLPMGKKVFFASDFHLGVPDLESSQIRERKIVEWLDSIAPEAEAIFLLGDLFDTWFEYREVVPRGFVRLLGKLAELSDRGIRIDIFTGNHDFWTRDYFQDELGAQVHTSEILLQIGDKRFNLGHGDGLGPGDRRYKMLKNILSNPAARFLYLRLHPNLGIRLASYFSQRGYKHGDAPLENYLGADKEFLVQYAQAKIEKENIDYFIFGHRHLPIEYRLSNGSYYYNTGDWINYQSYVAFDGDQCKLLAYQKDTSAFIHDSQNST